MAVREEVNWKMSADTAEVVRAWQQMAQGQQKVIDQLEKMGKVGVKSGGDMESSMGAAFARYATGAVAINIATRAVHEYIDANRKLIQQSSETTLSLDESFRGVRLVGKLFDEQAARRAELSIQATANKHAVRIPQANAAAYQLASGGVPMEEILAGGGLEEFLKMAKATNAAGRGEDMKATARSATMFLSATGEGMNSEGLHNLGRSMSGLFQTNVEMADLEELAAVGKGIKEMGGQVKSQDMLAMYSILRDTIPAAESATHFRNSILNLATASDDPKSKAALRRMGIKPEQVDFVGEDMEQVFTTLAAGVQRLKPEERTVMLNRIFGQRNIVGAQAMMAGVGLMPERRRMAGDESSYDSAIALAESGVTAERVRAENKQMQSLQGGGNAEIMTESISREAQLRADGWSPVGVKVRGWGRGAAETMGFPGMADAGENLATLNFGPVVLLTETLQAISRALGTDAKPREILLRDGNGNTQRATERPAQTLGE